MPTLRKRRAGPLATEFIITESELALAFQWRAGKLKPSQATRQLLDWRWSVRDACEFLDAIDRAGRTA